MTSHNMTTDVDIRRLAPISGQGWLARVPGAILLVLNDPNGQELGALLSWAEVIGDAPLGDRVNSLVARLGGAAERGGSMIAVLSDATTTEVVLLGAVEVALATPSGVRRLSGAGSEAWSSRVPAGAVVAAAANAVDDPRDHDLPGDLVLGIIPAAGFVFGRTDSAIGWVASSSNSSALSAALLSVASPEPPTAAAREGALIMTKPVSEPDRAPIVHDAALASPEPAPAPAVSASEPAPVPQVSTPTPLVEAPSPAQHHAPVEQAPAAPAPVTPAPAPVLPVEVPVSSAPLAPSPAVAAPVAPTPPGPPPAPPAPEPAHIAPPPPASGVRVVPLGKSAGPSAVPAAAAAPAPVEAPSEEVEGVHCARGHFNDPRARYCAVCGIGMVQGTVRLTRGERPPLGVLLLSTGRSVPLTTDLILGREPDAEPSVVSGSALGITLAGNDVLTVGRVHAEVRLRGWDAFLIDRSRNGTFVWDDTTQAWRRIEPASEHRMTPGERISFGPVGAVYETSHNQHS